MIPTDFNARCCILRQTLCPPQQLCYLHQILCSEYANEKSESSSESRRLPFAFSRTVVRRHSPPSGHPIQAILQTCPNGPVSSSIFQTTPQGFYLRSVGPVNKMPSSGYLDLPNIITLDHVPNIVPTVYRESICLH
jgi:hypothetical protein